MQKKALKPLSLITYSDFQNDEAEPEHNEIIVELEEDEDNEDEDEEAIVEILKRSVDPSFWAARGKRDGEEDDFFAAR